MSVAQKIFMRALQQDHDAFRKRAFVPMGSVAEKLGQQASGPGGMPVDPAAGGGMPMDPAMAGGMPMDPAMAGGAPPMDPAMAGGMPADPMAGGMPPMDPMAGGMPADPMAGGMPGEEPAPEGADEPIDLGAEGEAPEEGALTQSDAEIVDAITNRTLDTVQRTLEMVGKAKIEKPEEAAPEAAAPAEAEGAAEQPEQVPGPVTGQPMEAGALPGLGGAAPKTAEVLSRISKGDVKRIMAAGPKNSPGAPVVKRMWGNKRPAHAQTSAAFKTQVAANKASKANKAKQKKTGADILAEALKRSKGK